MEKAMSEKKKTLALIVDDGPGIVELVAERLAREGFAVVSASDAEKAEEEFDRECPDLMLVDYSLPGRSGLQLIEKLKTASHSHGCEEMPPFIVMTGHGDERLAVEMMKLGASDYLIKDSEFLSKIGPAAVRVLRESRTRRQLRESENRYRDLIENINDAIYILSPEGRITYISGPIRAMSGYYPEEITGREFTEWIHPEDLPELKKSFADSMAGILAPAEFRFRKKDGSYGWGRTSSRPIMEKGRVAGLRGLLSDITEYRELQSDYRRLFDSMLDGFALHEMIFDDRGKAVDYRFISVNPAFETQTGLKAEDTVGRKISEVMPEYYREWVDAYAPVVTTGEAARFERLSMPLGRYYDVLAFRPKPGQFACIFKDVTEQREAAAKLREQASMLEMAGRMSRFGGWIVDLEADVCHWSDEVALIHEEAPGFSPSVEQGIDFYAPEWRDRITDVFGACARDGKPFDEEMEIITAKGNRRWVRAIGRAERGADSRIVRVMGSFQDITDRKKAEADLRNSEDKFRRLVEHSPDGIFIQLEGKLEYLNPEAVRIFGARSEAELKGTPVLDRFHPDFHETIRKRLDLLTKEKKRVPEIEEVCLRLDGSAFPSMVSAVPFEKDGRDGAIVTVRDITEQKTMEEDLLKSQKIESLGMLAGGIAHDFNNILTGITANLSMLLSRLGRSGEEGEALNEALAAANTAKGLTRQLLAFAEGGKPVKKELDAGKTISEAARLALRGTPCSLELKIAPDLWSIEADETQLTQVIVNLASNAVQAMPGGGKLTISAANEERDGGRFVNVIISDTGTGIPEKYIKSVFDPYFTTKKQGHGLGLPMAFSIVKGHGGEISVSSEAGRGTTFSISLPATGRLPGPAAAPAAGPARGSGRVLVMDDEEVVLKACRRMLTSLGYECELAEEGMAALAAYEKAAAEGRPFSVVIMDLTIQGGMGGKETVAELRKRHPDARVIASSGYAAGTPVSEYSAMGFDGLLAKPYNYEEMAALLEKLTGGKK